VVPFFCLRFILCVFWWKQGQDVTVYLLNDIKRESVKPLQYYCNALPISYFIDQRRLSFWYKMQNSNNIVLRTLSSLKHYSFVAIAAKYGTNSHNVSFKNAVLQYLISANSAYFIIFLYIV